MSEVNIVIRNENYKQEKDLIPLLFDDEPYVVKDNVDMRDLLVEYDFFRSKSEAYKNGWKDEIPKGFSLFTIGKLRRVLTIFNPIKTKPVPKEYRD